MRIAAVFAGVGSASTAKTERLHRVFAELAKQHADLLPGMTFVTLSDYPHSPQLEAALYRLQNAGLLGAVNPVYEKLEIREDRLARLLEQMRQIDEEATNQLVALGASAQESLHT
jgi:hypothetical protein